MSAILIQTETTYPRSSFLYELCDLIHIFVGIYESFRKLSENIASIFLFDPLFGRVSGKAHISEHCMRTAGR